MYFILFILYKSSRDLPDWFTTTMQVNLSQRSLSLFYTYATVCIPRLRHRHKIDDERLPEMIILSLYYSQHHAKAFTLYVYKKKETLSLLLCRKINSN